MGKAWTLRETWDTRACMYSATIKRAVETIVPCPVRCVLCPVRCAVCPVGLMLCPVRTWCVPCPVRVSS